MGSGGRIELYISEAICRTQMLPEISGRNVHKSRAEHMFDRSWGSDLLDGSGALLEPTASLELTGKVLIFKPRFWRT